MSIPHEIGRNIVSIRTQKSITQERLALDSDMSVSYLRRIEHGTANPSIRALSRLAVTLQVPFSAITSVDEEASPYDFP